MKSHRLCGLSNRNLSHSGAWKSEIEVYTELASSEVCKDLFRLLVLACRSSPCVSLSLFPQCVSVSMPKLPLFTKIPSSWISPQSVTTYIQKVTLRGNKRSDSSISFRGDTIQPLTELKRDVKVQEPFCNHETTRMRIKYNQQRDVWMMDRKLEWESLMALESTDPPLPTED